MRIADMVYDLSSVWATARAVFPYFDRLPFDWDELYRDYLDKILQVKTDGEFHALLGEFTASLGDGHTKYVPPAEFRPSSPPFKALEKPSRSVSDGVLTIKINDFLSDYSALIGEWLRSAEGIGLVRLDITQNIGGNTDYAARVAELFIPGVFHACQKWTQRVDALELASASQLVRAGEETIKKYLQDGLIGEDELSDARRIAAHTKFREYTDSFGAEGSAAVYDGALELLISPGTMSAAEDFAAMLKSTGRAVLVGRPTFGSTGTPCLIPLRCGGRAQVVSVGYRLLDGTEFIGRGIAPDRYEEQAASCNPRRSVVE